MVMPRATTGPAAAVAGEPRPWRNRSEERGAARSQMNRTHTVKKRRLYLFLIPFYCTFPACDLLCMDPAAVPRNTPTHALIRCELKCERWGLLGCICVVRWAQCLPIFHDYSLGRCSILLFLSCWKQKCVLWAWSWFYFAFWRGILALHNNLHGQLSYNQNLTARSHYFPYPRLTW